MIGRGCHCCISSWERELKKSRGDHRSLVHKGSALTLELDLGWRIERKDKEAEVLAVTTFNVQILLFEFSCCGAVGDLV